MLLRRPLASLARRWSRVDVSLCQPLCVPRVRAFANTSDPASKDYWDDAELDYVPPRPGSPEVEEQGYTAVGDVTEEVLAAYDKLYKKKQVKKWRRDKYSFEKQYKRGLMKTMFDNSMDSFFLCFQHNMDIATITTMGDKIATNTGGRVKLRRIIKNSLCRLVVEEEYDEKLAPLSALFRGPTSVVYGLTAEHMFEDLRAVLDAGKNKAIFLGGQVDGCVVDHVQIDSLKEVTSALHLRSELIQAMQQPAHGLVRVLKFPSDHLVKALDFNAKAQSEGEDGPADEADTEAPSA